VLRVFPPDYRPYAIWQISGLISCVIWAGHPASPSPSPSRVLPTAPKRAALPSRSGRPNLSPSLQASPFYSIPIVSPDYRATAPRSGKSAQGRRPGRRRERRSRASEAFVASGASDEQCEKREEAPRRFRQYELYVCTGSSGKTNWFR
jgi:hypothetical protein